MTITDQLLLRRAVAAPPLATTPTRSERSSIRRGTTRLRVPSGPRPQRPPPRLASALRAMRPRQWVKNGLVLAAPFAAGTLLTGSVLVPALLAVLVMCAAASCTYLLNDIADRDRDRLHPTKCRRPIASGDFGIRAAKVLAASAATGVGPRRRTHAVDVRVRRRLPGPDDRLQPQAQAHGAPGARGRRRRVRVACARRRSRNRHRAQPAFLIVVGAGALFLAVGKRYAELYEFGADAAQHRPVLVRYTLDGLYCTMTASLGVAVLSYVVWAWGAEALTAAEPWLALSVIPVTIAAARAYRRAVAGGAADPTELVLSDRVLQLAAAAAGALLMIGLYLV